MYEIMNNITLLQLPFEVLEEILKVLDLVDLRNLMLTCKSLKDFILKNNTIWKTVFQDKIIVGSVSHRSHIFTSYNQYRITNNWCCGIYKSKLIIHHHTNYIPWLKYYNSEALLVSLGSEIHCFPTDKKGQPVCKTELWKLDVPKVNRNDVRTNDISRFILKNNIMVCGNRDGCAAIYEVDAINEKPNFLYHIKDCHENGQVEVSAVELVSNSDTPCALTGSIYSSNLRMWHFNVNGYRTNEKHDILYLQDIKLTDDVGIRCMSLNNEKLAIGLNGNSKPLLVDINMGKLLITAEETINARQTIRDIKWHNQNTIILVTHSGNMQCIDVRTNEVVYNVMDPFQSTLYCVKSDNDRALVVGTSEYSRCVLFDIRNQSSHVQMYFTQKKSSPVYSLDFDSTKLIAAADQSIAVLNFNVNPSSSLRRDYSQKFEFVNR